MTVQLYIERNTHAYFIPYLGSSLETVIHELHKQRTIQYSDGKGPFARDVIEQLSNPEYFNEYLWRARDAS